MSHLLAIAVGPVQEFIAAARRTRDLWFGSFLLSEISKAVARSIREQGDRRLIFPHPDTDLTSGDDRVNVANVILAELPSGEPRDVAAKARQAAKECWERFAMQARTDAGNAIVNDIWNDQIGDVIEFYAAWVPHTNPEHYKTDRAGLMRLLVGRKNCRNFRPQRFNDTGIPKSSLDGQRPSVFVQPASRSQRDALRASWSRVLRLADGEELDIIGVTKRVGKKPGESHPSYASVARIAAETWLRGKQNHPRFEDFKRASGEVPGLNRVAQAVYDYFPHEGTVVFKDRHPDLVDELGPEAKPKLEAVAKLLKELGGEPNPYLAVIVADGDKMGAAIAALGSTVQHRAFSQTLAGFAIEARNIVNDHNGVLVYAGGDDVLAFLPVDKCLSCARKLHDDFGERLAKYGYPTLSVGIAIGHFMENLEDLLEYGRAAEKAAKKVDGKNALAVHLHKRGGAPIKTASRWDTTPEKQLHKFADLMNEGIIPTKLPYELRTMATLYRDWPTDLARHAIRQDLPRLIAKKASTSETTVRAELADELDRVDDALKLLALAEELLVARQIATALRQSTGRLIAAEEVTS